MGNAYKPPYTITPAILSTVAEIGELVGRYTATAEKRLSPILRRGNRIRTIQASLAIENNSLTVEQVTAIIDGKRVMGLPREIQEVRNAFAAYENIDSWNPASMNDLLRAHELLTAGLIDESGKIRSGGVGIFKGKELIHMAPPADRVHDLMKNLMSWLASAAEHPIVTSCIFHYEFEFIHPFSDGNGRLGRLWQTLILSKWKPLWAFLPVETFIGEQQETYYAVLGRADAAGDATPFVAFMAQILKQALEKSIATEVATEVAMEVKRVIGIMKGEMKRKEMQDALELKNNEHFRLTYLLPALAEGVIEMSQPESPTSPTQKYRLTAKGRNYLEMIGDGAKRR
jgi:Fic family protein